MKKFAVFSGFLGSGKTTTMMALTKYHTAQRLQRIPDHGRLHLLCQ